MDNEHIFIKKIEIRNFRSIRNILINVDNYNTFVGLNDVGKSNLLKALNLFFNGQTDYLNDFDFSSDFSYLFSKKTHRTKEIKIKLTFSIPSAYRDAGDVVWEKAWRVSGLQEDIIYKVGKNNKREKLSSRSRVQSSLHKLKYRYIPAVKSREYYKGLLSDLYESVSSSLDSPLKNSIRDFSDNLKKYTKDINEQALKSLGLNSELSVPDKLNDIFRALCFITTDKGSNFSIDLQKRGDGIQTRHIPFILKHIADEDQKSRPSGSTRIVTIWGFEEPENGLELSKSFDMAKELWSYSESIQMFITTHSPAFYLNKDKKNSKVFFTVKNGQTGTKYNNELEKNELTTKMGLMPLVAPFIRKQQERFDNINKDSLINKDTILVEGKYDKKYLLLAMRKYSKDSLYKKVKNGELRIYTKSGEGGCEAELDLVKGWVFAKYESKLYVIFDKDGPGSQSDAEIKPFLKETNFKYRSRLRHGYWTFTEDVQKMFRAGLRPQIEVESLLSSSLWESLVKQKYASEKSPSDLVTLLNSKFSINESVSESIKKLENTYPSTKFLLKYEPDDGKKKAIYTLVEQIMKENPSSDVLSGFKPTIKELEKFFEKGRL